MVGATKGISLVLMGLLLACNSRIAQAQFFNREAAPVQLAPSVDSDDSPDSYPNDPSDDDGIAPQPRATARIVDADDASGDENPAAGEAMDGEVDENGDYIEEYEVITERYPGGAVKIEREVKQDPEGNYLNHGPWKMWDQRGNPLAQGEFDYGNRTGTWIRWYWNQADGEILSKMPYDQFSPPFISQATFKEDQLHGSWTIWDSKKHKISQWEFRDGRRHGTSTWWFASGRKMREVQYRDGDMDGQFVEWGTDGNVIAKESYQGGRKQGSKKATHPDGGKKSEGVYLLAKETEKTPDDWWNARVQTTSKAGKDEKHGPWSAWYPSGQLQLKGNYEHDLQVGVHTWWHSNGQKALEGRYANGKQDGKWIWWHANGQKSIQGEYAHGNPTGKWMWWKENGKIAQSADMSHSEGVVIETRPGKEPNALPQAALPHAPTKAIR